LKKRAGARLIARTSQDNLPEENNMTLAWWLNAAQLYVSAVGALLIFLYLFNSRRFMDQWLTPEGKVAYKKHSRLLILAVGILAAWVLLQYLAILFP
jgi:hypothetical protein